VSSWFKRLPMEAAVVVCLCLVGAGSVQAQYFGRNKVRYDARDARVLKTEHFDIHFDDSATLAAPVVARLAERWHERLTQLLDHRLSGRQPIVFYSGHPGFEQTNTVSGQIPESVGGVTDGQKRRVVLPSAGALAETDHVLGHELVHAFQYDIVGRGAKMETLPLWFIEGMAEYLSLGPVDPHTAMWMRDAARASHLPKVRDLDNPRYFPYRYGHALWAYVGGRWGDAAVGRALKAARTSRGPLRALEKVLGVSEADLTRDWHASIRDAYVVDDGVFEQTKDGIKDGPKDGPKDRAKLSPSDRAKDEAKRVGLPGGALVKSTAGSGLNLAPALSPDGRRVVYLSESEGGLELFLADVDTDRPGQRLVKRRFDPHFENLQFVGSAGAWAPDGGRFAFAAVRRGRAVITVFDADHGRIERQIDVPEVDEVLSPTWSPDGTRLAFSAKRGGFADLFVYDLASSRVEALTEDAFADLQPTWSPDGASIAFVTDRFGTDLDQLRWGRYRLARFVVASRTIEPLPSIDGAKNVNPQWGRDGLFFLSDRGGTSNVYRLDVATGAIYQVTDVTVGLSGVTSLSPALAAASGASRIVVAAFSAGHYRLYTLDDPTLLLGHDLDERASGSPLPPLQRECSQVQELLDDPSIGRPEPTTYAQQDYHPRLTSDGFSEPFFSVGQNRFGMNFVGGGSLFWSDLLGDRRLATGILVNGGPKDVSGIVAYENRSHRWNWGVAAQQSTFRSSAVSWGLSDLDGRAVALQQMVRFREIDRAATLRVGYPFERGRRIEMSAGYRRVSFSTESEIHTSAFDTGERLGVRRLDVPSPSGLDLAELGVAVVQDEALFGPTSAIEGSRMRLELTPTLGTKSFLGLRADYRRYVRPTWPLVLAGRVFHYGRYGRDANDSRLSPLFTGYSSFARGYDGLGDGRCQPGGCQRLDDFVGSKILVTNFEVRVPAFFFLGRRRAYGPVPAELITFFDAATAWRSVRDMPLVGASRPWIRSWGAGLRVNFLGLALGELDYVRPLDLDGRHSMIQFRFGAAF
jgi:Tol biopolymer transport system component